MNLNDRVLIIRPLFSCMIIEKGKKRLIYLVADSVIDRVLSRIRRSAYSDRFPRGSAVIFLAVHSDVKNYPVLVTDCDYSWSRIHAIQMDKIRFRLLFVLFHSSSFTSWYNPTQHFSYPLPPLLYNNLVYYNT